MAQQNNSPTQSGTAQPLHNSHRTVVMQMVRQNNDITQTAARNNSVAQVAQYDPYTSATELSHNWHGMIQ